MPRIIITEPDTTPQPYRLKIDRIVTKIGRAQGNDIILSDESSSSYHCKIKRVEGGFILADLGSTNGIKFKGTQYTIIDLKDGQTVQIGDHVDLEFTLTAEETAQLATEDFESHQKTSFPNSNKTKDAETKSEELEAEDSDKKSKSKKRQKDNDVSEAKSKRNKSSRSESNKSKPQSKAKASPKSQQVKSQDNKAQESNMSLNFIIFMILAVLCFLAGLAIRHYQDHSSFIFG